jgi:hypothetical protein
MAANDRPDAGGGAYGPNSGGFDQLGYSTLMAYREAVPTSSIIEVAASDFSAPEEYFNLQGLRVAVPSNGIFICRQGTLVTKVRL